jgi:hypothetical protein
VAGLSGDALKQLTDFAGGIEAFGQQVSSYVRSYFTADEQAAIQASELQRTLAAAGIDTSSLSSRASFRALVDAQDVGSEEGRRQLSVLLAQSESFAQVADYLSQNGLTLAALAEMAPGGSIADLMAPGAIGGGDSGQGLSTVVSAVTDSNAQVVDALDRLGESLTGALATVAGNTQRSSEYLRDLFEEQTAAVQP